MDKLKQLIKDPIALTGLILILAFSVLALLAPVIAPPAYEDEPYRIPRGGWGVTPKAPSPDHPMGTTEGQYDLFYGVVWGARTAFYVGLVVVAGSAVLGLAIGSISAFYGGKLDETLMRVTDIFMAFPFIMAAVVIVTILGKGLDNVMIALIAFGWMEYARLIRGSILQLREMEYVLAARALGASDLRLIVLHILPNGIFPIIVQATMNIGTVVIVAASLSFLGLGAPSGYADWGQLVSLSRNWIIGQPGNPLAYWYTLVWPGLAISLFVLGWNLLGDGLRDIFDPRLEREPRA